MTAFQVTVAPVAGELAQIRQRLGAWLDAAGIGPDLRNDALLATNEAAANAIQHAAPSNSLTLRAAIQDQILTIEVADTGNWDGQTRQPGDGNSGLGFPIITEAMQTYEINTSPAGTTLRICQPI